MTIEAPNKADLDRKLSELMHEARHDLQVECQVIISNAIQHNALNGSRVGITQFGAADRLHKNAMERARSYLVDFERRTALPASEITGWARPHLENLNNSLIGVVKPSPAFRQQQSDAPYRAIFAQRVDSLLRDVETGFPNLSPPRHPARNNSSNVMGSFTEPGPKEHQELRFAAAEWRNLPTDKDVKAYIAEITRLLDDIILEMKQSNNDPSVQYLSELERQQLKSVLETALIMMKAPLVEQGLLQRARDGLQNAIFKAGEKGFEALAARAGRGLLSYMPMERAHDLLSQLLHWIF